MNLLLLSLKWLLAIKQYNVLDTIMILFCIGVHFPKGHFPKYLVDFCLDVVATEEYTASDISVSINVCVNGKDVSKETDVAICVKTMKRRLKTKVKRLIGRGVISDSEE